MRTLSWTSMPMARFEALPWSTRGTALTLRSSRSNRSRPELSGQLGGAAPHDTAIDFHVEGLSVDGSPVPEPSSVVEYVKAVAA